MVSKGGRRLGESRRRSTGESGRERSMDESGRERILCESGNESRREIKLGESGCERSLA